MKEALETLKHAHCDSPVEDLLLQRWSPRAFADRSVSDTDLRTIFSAGSWAASSFNEQPWRFVVGRKGDAVWQGILDCLTPANQSWAKAAPVLYASFAKRDFSQNGTPNRVAQHDVGAASAQISLQATALALHTHGMSGFEVDKVRSRFAVPEDFEPVAWRALGYLGDPESLDEKQREQELKPRTRKNLAEVVFAEWGKSAL